MQKYNEEDLYKSFSRISKNYISILQKKISDYLNSLDTDIRKAAKKVFLQTIKSGMTGMPDILCIMIP